MSAVCHIDFETRSMVDLKKAGPYRYAEDASTSAMCLSWKFSNARRVRTWFWKTPERNKEALQKLFDFVKAGGTIKGHNVEFEYAIWNKAFLNQTYKSFDVAPLKIPQLRCTAAEAATMTYPRALANLCIVLNTTKKKDLIGKKVMLKLSKPRKPTRDNRKVWHESAEDFQTLINYNRDDVLAEEACGKMLRPLTPKALRLFHLTIEINERGLAIDLDLIKNAAVFADRLVEESKGELLEITGGEITGVKQVAKMRKHLALHGLEMDNLQADTVEDTLLRKDLSTTARRLLELRQLLSKSSIAKYKTMLDAVCKDGRVRGSLMFSGATTGRWTGKGIQPHNFPKSSSAEIDNILALLKIGNYELLRMLYPDVQTALSICLRAMLIAGPGRTFFDLDWNAIEARIILWLAGDEAGLQTYIDGIDAYVELAALALDKDPGACTKEDMGEVTKDDRQYTGKPGVLGGGFGMGWEKFALKEDIDPVLAHKIIKTWRTLHKPVVQFWKDLINAAVEATECPGKRVRVGKHISYKVEGTMLTCRLPSGRLLYYQQPQVQQIWKTIKVKTPLGPKDGAAAYKELYHQKPNTVTASTYRIIKVKDQYYKVEEKRIPQKLLTYINYKGAHGFRTKTYGGHQAENVTQATAVDIMGGAMLRTNKEFPFVLTVHDEGLAEPDKGANKERYIKLMSVPEPWAEGLPLKTEFWQHQRFGSY